MNLNITHHLDHNLEHRLFNKLIQFERKIMTAISDNTAKLNVLEDRIEAAVTDIAADIQNLSDQIKALQNSPGPISTEDQALLDAIETRTASIADKLDVINAKTPPVIPAP